MESPVLNTKDLASLLKTSERTVRYWAANDMVPSYKIGSQTFYNKKEILNLIGQTDDASDTINEWLKIESGDPVVDWLKEQLLINLERRERNTKSEKSTFQTIPQRFVV